MRLILLCCILFSHTVVALEVQVSHQRGFYNQAFQVVIEGNMPDTNIRYTVNGAKPSPINGTDYTNPVSINTTTTLRVLAYNAIDTIETAHTYIYLNEIWSASYMSDHITKNQSYIPLLDSAFMAIPSIAVTIAGEVETEEDIEPTEIPASVEMLFPDGSNSGFYAPCGIKTWGGSPSNPKKNYRLVFKKIFGAGKLKYDVFDDGYNYPISPVNRFDNLLLRAGSQDGLNAEYNNELSAQFIRNRFVCDLAMEMGYPAPHGRFVHLFLNGAYAGHYHLMERPDEHFFQDYIFPEVDEDSIEVKKNDVYWKLPNAETPYYQTLLSYSNGLTSKLNYEKLDDFINVDAAADYITFHQFIGNFDWHDQQNTLLGAIPVKGAGPFEFVVWDVDFSLGNKGVFSIAYEFNKHGAVPENLFNAKEFKFLQGDKVECLCKNDGALTPNKLKEKYLYRANQVEVSLIAEAARWGNNSYTFGGDFPDHKDVENWEVNTHWKAEFEQVYNEFLTKRTGAFIEKYINLERYSTLHAVEVNINNNNIELTHSNDNGTVVYMLNGEDPREFNGLLNSNAIQYNNQPIKLVEPIELKARFYKNTSTGRKWSHMCPEKFYPNQNYQSLVINELHIQPNELIIDGDSVSSKKFEFIEIKNTSNELIFLQDVAFSDGVKCIFKKYTQIPAQDYFVVAADSLYFIEKYGFSPDATFTGKLNNSNETLQLIDPFGNIIDSLTYQSFSPWPILGDLNDQSIALKESILDNSQAGNWEAQSVNFTPGTANQFCDNLIKIDGTVAAASCFGNADGFIIPNLSGGSPPYELTWSTGSTDQQLINLSAGNYTLTAKDKNNCIVSQSFVVTQPAKLTALIVQEQTIEAVVSGGEAPYQYQWSKVTVVDRNACEATASVNLQSESLCLSPNNIRTVNVQAESATLTWNSNSNDSSYFIQYKKLSDDELVSANQTSNSITLNNLESCTTYEVRIVSFCASNENSNFSSSFYFKTSGCSLCSKAQNLSNINSTSTSISITWEAVPDVSYILYYKTKEANSWYTFETWINFVIFFNLDACQTYEWKVAIKCGKENISAQSDALQFTTNGCKINGDVAKEFGNWQIYPNPVKQKLYIDLSDLSLAQEFLEIQIYDATGKMHFVKKVRIEVNTTTSENIALDVASLVPGFYYLNISGKNIQLSKKIEVYSD